MQVIIDRFEGEKAVLIFPDSQSVTVNKAELPGNAKEGDSLKVVIVSDDLATLSKEEQAKTILNEILKSDV